MIIKLVYEWTTRDLSTFFLLVCWWAQTEKAVAVFTQCTIHAFEHMKYYSLQVAKVAHSLANFSE